MKVLLIKDTPKVGKKGEVKEVADGYGQNYLVGKGFALKATPEVLKKEASRVAKLKQEKEDNKAHSLTLKELLESKTYIVTQNGEVSSGKLFGSITKDMIAKSIGLENLTKKNILLTGNIRQVGLYTVGVQLAEQIKAEVSIEVEISQ